MQCAQGVVELRAGSAGAGDALVNVEVVTSDTGCKEVGFLPVCGLLPCRYSRVADQLRHHVLQMSRI